jgi:hypothetical protein
MRCVSSSSRPVVLHPTTAGASKARRSDGENGAEIMKATTKQSSGRSRRDILVGTIPSALFGSVCTAAAAAAGAAGAGKP